MDAEAKAAALEKMKADKSAALSLEQLAKAALKAGAAPAYVANRYGFTLQRCLDFLAALESAKEAKRERQEARQGSN